MQAAKVNKVLFVMLLALALFVAGCGGDEQTQGEDTQGDSAEKQSEVGQTTEETTDTKERTKEDTTVEKKDAKEESSGGEVSLQVGGDPGTAFSGVCRIGDEENELNGQVPESFSYDLGGQQLECEIRKDGTGSAALEVLLTGPGNRIRQQTNSPEGTINLVYSENGVSYSTSSSSSSSSVNQVVSNSSSGSSSSSSSSSH